MYSGTVVLQATAFPEYLYTIDALFAVRALWDTMKFLDRCKLPEVSVVGVLIH
jgi:hypothetical protein